MADQLQWKFDPHLDYQLEAMSSVVGALEGTPRYNSEFALGEDIVPNLPEWEYLDEQALAQNVVRIQQQNRVQLRQPAAEPRQRSLLNLASPIADFRLEMDDGLVLENIGFESWRYPHFTVEMETGTGKTYVYLRTIYELRQRYGFRKFIIVVPSIAIYEGVVKSFQIMKPHFNALYGNENVGLVRYDSSRMSDLRTFATSSFVQILVMTLASFNSSKGRYPNRIYRPSEQLPGERLPYQFIQETRPILILDEPQNMGTDLAKEALRTLHPLFALRYSATHTETPNLLYQLTPFDAYDRGLVKRIEVTGVTEQDNFNKPLLVLEEVDRNGSTVYAKVRTHVNKGGRLGEQVVTLYQNDDLYQKTGNERHRGWVVEEINKHYSDIWVRFTNGEELTPASIFAGNKEAIFRAQINEAVRHHMKRQERLLARGIKVLSLFFIDRVANYVEEDGLIRRLFEEAFERYKQHYSHFRDRAAADVHSGYFARMRATGSNEEKVVDTSGSNQSERAAEKEAFQLIMRDKERLLSFDEPTAFIFAHSALKEGWDNPNVFVICTLNQTTSERKKRQEIGRGLRIAVSQEGDRIFDTDINVLLVVANESYEHYVNQLQQEYEDEGHFRAAPPPPTRADRQPAERRDELFTLPEFRAFWEKLARRTNYEIHTDTDQLVQECIDRLNNVRDETLQPRIVIQRGKYVVMRYTITLLEVSDERARLRVQWAATNDTSGSRTERFKRGANLAKLLADERLRGFTIKAIVEGDDPHVRFANDVTVYVDQPYSFESEHGHEPVEHATLAPQEHYPVPNMLARAARGTGLTRPTINRIFRGLTDRKKRLLLQNPEGFTGFFIGEIKKALGDHIAAHLEFTLADSEVPYDLEDLFPPKSDFPQSELIEAGPQGLYTQVQTDSDVERNFVQHRLHDDPHLVAYFKFPPKFKIRFPKYLGNYNPDWGIIRRAPDGQHYLHLIRETKGQEEYGKLQYAHERFKIIAAHKHFREVDIDYWVVTDESLDWSKTRDERPDQSNFLSMTQGENELERQRPTDSNRELS